MSELTACDRARSCPDDLLEQDFLDCVRSAQVMGLLHGRPIDHPSSWALSYERPVSGLIWVWQPGQNCHPNPIG